MTPSETPSPPAKKTFPLGALLTSVVALTTLVGLILHLMGHSSRTSYLEALGIPAELFFQTPEQHIILGYHILVGAFFAFLKSVWLWATLMGIIFVVGPLATHSELERTTPNSRGKLRSSFKARMNELSPLWRTTGYSLAATIILAFCVWLAFSVLHFLVIRSDQLGAEHGHQQAVRMKECLSAEPSTSFWKDGKPWAEGVLLASSSTSVAFWDPKLNLIRVLPLEGLELRRPMAVGDSSER